MEEKIVDNKDLTVIQRILQYKRYLIGGLGIAVMIFLLSLSYLALMVSGNKIYPNVKVMDVEVGRLDKAGAISRLQDYYSNSNDARLLLKADNSQMKVEFNELKVDYDFETAVNNAYKVGRDENFFKKLVDLVAIDLKGKMVDLPISYDSNALNDKLSILEGDQTSLVQDDTYEIKNDTLTVHYGHPGKGIDKESAAKQIEQKLKKGIDAEITFKETDISPKALTADDISVEPKDASIRVDNYREIKYIPEVYGAVFDKEVFNHLYKDNKGKESFSMSVDSKRPNITLSELKAKLFTDTLATHDTYYGSSPQNRKHNVQLAASKVGGVILAPGDEFSYNAVVGPRTADRGFQMAHVYSNGKVIDDFGGGICQVSSTLYNAVLKADLEVVSRRNHMFTVGYAKPGLDATVSYGSIDFKFRNNKSWPIKIVNNSTSTDVNFSILGVNEEPDKTIEFRTETLKVIPHNTITTLDPNLPEGKIATDQAGTDGYVVSAYKITKRAGVVEKEEFLHKDTYQALDAKVRKGTKKVEVTIPEQSKLDPQKPTNKTKPINEKPKTDINNQNTNTSSPEEPLEPVINQDSTRPVEQ